MKKVFSKIVLLLTTVCLLLSVTACNGKEPPARDYTKKEVISAAVENTCKETDIKVRGQADVYIAQLGETVPVTLSADVKNRDGKIDFTVWYEGTATGRFTYKDGVLYTPDGGSNGEDLSLEALLSQVGGKEMLSELYAQVQADEIIKPQNGVYTLSSEADLKPALDFLKAFVLENEGTQLGEFIASYAQEGYTREQLVADLKKVFDSRSIAVLAKNIDALFASFGLPVTLQDIVDPLLEQMGYTKTNLYALAVSYLGAAGTVAVPKPKAGQTAYEYAIEAFGGIKPEFVANKLGFRLADIKELVLSYVDNDDCTFGDMWDMAVGFLDESLYMVGMLTGAPQIMPPFLSCANLAEYTVNTCKGSLTMGVDASSLRISTLSFTVDVDINYGTEKIKAYLDFTGALTYGETVTVSAPLRG